MKTYVILLAFFASTLFPFAAFAQKKPILTDAGTVTETVSKEMDDLFQSEEFLKKKNKNFADVKGYMTIDIGIVQSGKVSTFFKADSDIHDIDFINWMSDYILQHKFRFRLEKQQRYKVRYKANFL